MPIGLAKSTDVVVADAKGAVVQDVDGGVNAPSRLRAVDAHIARDGRSVDHVNHVGRVCLCIRPIAHAHRHRTRATPRTQRRATGAREPLNRETGVCIGSGAIGRW